MIVASCYFELFIIFAARCGAVTFGFVAIRGVPVAKPPRQHQYCQMERSRTVQKGTHAAPTRRSGRANMAVGCDQRDAITLVADRRSVARSMLNTATRDVRPKARHYLITCQTFPTLSPLMSPGVVSPM